MNIVPFGKYKGQPVEVMAQDAQYLTWLQAQSWFIERYKRIHELLLANKIEPSETPEHNKMQAKFASDLFLDDFIEFVLRNKLIDEHTYNISEPVAVFEKYGFDVVVRFTMSCSIYIELKPHISDDYPAVLRQVTSVTNYTTYNMGKPFQHPLVGHRMVITEGFSAAGASFEEVVKIFHSRGVFLCMLNDI